MFIKELYLCSNFKYKKMEIIRKITELKKAVDSRRALGSVGFVPTMGALHAGHLSLVNRCRKENPTVVVSVFVNPTQFNDKEDLKNYPRTEEADFALLEKAGCDIVFAPSVEEVYPEEDTRRFDFGQLEQVMEGAHRPDHFNGVAQVVSKLFDFVAPDNAYFGEKDFQQVAIIKKMVVDLGLNVNIVPCPIQRDTDGLALSSRNMLLNEEQRAIAPVIYMTLKEAVNRKEWASVEEVKKWVVEQIDSNEQMKVEYFTIVNADTLQDVESWDVPCAKQGCIAVKVGKIRLIDNIKFA